MNREKKLTLSNRLIDDVAIALNDNSWEMEWYLDLEEERTTFLSEYNEEDDVLEELIENDAEQKRFIPIPRGSSHEGWNQMERFIDRLDSVDEKTRNLLYISIEGKGAFGRFKDALFSIGLLGQWYKFKDREDCEAALNWLFSEDLIKEEDLKKGMKLYEDALEKQKRREEEIDNMAEGTKVACTSNHGHADKLTIDKMYDVLDERKDDLLIKIEDDRGRNVWMQKSYFNLAENTV